MVRDSSNANRSQGGAASALPPGLQPSVVLHDGGLLTSSSAIVPPTVIPTTNPRGRRGAGSRSNNNNQIILNEASSDGEEDEDENEGGDEECFDEDIDRRAAGSATGRKRGRPPGASNNVVVGGGGGIVDNNNEGGETGSKWRIPDARTKRADLDTSERWTVVRLYHKLKEEGKGRKKDNAGGAGNASKDAAVRVSEYLDVGIATVRRIWAEFQRTGEIVAHMRGNRSNHPTKFSRTKARCAIRMLLAERASMGQPTSGRQLFQMLKPHCIPEKVSYEVFRRFLRSEGFKYARSEYGKVCVASLIDNPRTLVKRQEYIRVLMENRRKDDSERRIEVYIDECSIAENHGSTNVGNNAAAANISVVAGSGNVAVGGGGGGTSTTIISSSSSSSNAHSSYLLVPTNTPNGNTNNSMVDDLNPGGDIPSSADINMSLPSMLPPLQQQQLHQHHHQQQQQQQAAAAASAASAPAAAESTTRRNAPPRKNHRYYFSAAITPEGMLPSSWWIFSPLFQNGGKNSNRPAFDPASFEKYFLGNATSEGKLNSTDGGPVAVGVMAQFEACFPNRKALFILDSARHHAFYHGIPKETSKKHVLIDFFQSRNIPIPANVTKDKLQLMLHDLKKRIEYRLETLARERGHEILWIPAKHTDWQPLCLMWSLIKNDVGRQYRVGRTMEETKDQIENSVKKYMGAQTTTALIRQTDAVLMKYNQLDEKREARDDEAEEGTWSDEDMKSDSSSNFDDEIEDFEAFLTGQSESFVPHCIGILSGSSSSSSSTAAAIAAPSSTSASSSGLHHHQQQQQQQLHHQQQQSLNGVTMNPSMSTGGSSSTVVMMDSSAHTLDHRPSKQRRS